MLARDRRIRRRMESGLPNLRSEGSSLGTHSNRTGVSITWYLELFHD